MPDLRRILILGGTHEALILARVLDADPRYYPISSLAGVTASPRVPDGESRRGGFGGAEGLSEYLLAQRIDAVVDATHPYASLMSCHAVHACDETRVPRVRLSRPAWVAQTGDDWRLADDTCGVVNVLRELGARVFWSAGVRNLTPLAALRSHHFIVRVIDSPGQLLALRSYELVIARGPFALESEHALLRDYGIEVLVAKNSGGDSSYPKIVAARTLGLPVIMLNRPPEPDGPSAPSVDAVMDCLAQLFTSA